MKHAFFKNNKNIVTYGTLLLCAVILLSIYLLLMMQQHKQYLSINEWGIRFENKQDKYGYTFDFHGITILDRELAESGGTCGGVIDRYYRVADREFQASEVDTSKLEKMTFVKSLNGFRYYRDNEPIPDFCGTELQESRQNFNPSIY